MEVGIKVVTENPRNGECRHVMSCFFYMISVDENRTPVELEPFTPKTDDEKERWADALKRKETLSA